MRHTEEHKAEIAQGMRDRWLDPEYRKAHEAATQLRREMKAAVRCECGEMFTNPKTRDLVQVGPENPQEKATAFVEAELERRVYAPYRIKLAALHEQRQAEWMARRQVRQTAAQAERDSRKTRREQAQELRRQARALYQQAKELEK